MNLQHTRIWLRLIALLALSPAQAPAETNDDLDAIASHFTKNWQDVEVVVFERLGVRETPGEEDRTPSSGERTLPAEFWSIADAQDVEPGFGIDAVTRPAVDGFLLGTAVGQPGFGDFKRPEPPEPSTPPATTAVAPAAPVTNAALTPPPPPPTPDALFRNAIKTFEASLESAALAAKPTTSKAMRSAAARLASQSNARILWHHRWTQPFGTGLAAMPVYIQAGYPVLGLKSLEGILHIRGNQGFSTTANLWLHGPFLSEKPEPLAVRATGEVGSTEATVSPFNQWHVLSESRNMKSGEVHYLDHPYFGVLVSVQRVTIPAELLTAYQTKKAADKASPPTVLQTVVE